MILDTDVLVDPIRNHPPALAWFAGLGEPPSASGVAGLELRFGAASASELKAVEVFLAPFPVLLPNEDDIERAGALAELHLVHGIDILDAITAALALRHGLPVATFNVKHFRAVPGLATVQPYQR